MPRRPDFMIASIGRSGSTMLASWLTTPPTHFVLHEPKLGSERRTRLLVMQLDVWGLSLEEVQERYWAIKEIEAKKYRAFQQDWNPQRVLVCVRDIRDVALSFFEKHRRQGNLDTYSDDWSRDYCLREAAELVELAGRLEAGGTAFRVARYEDFARSAQERRAIADFVSWPGEGSGDGMLDAIDRGFEAERHGRSIVPGLPPGDPRGLDPALIESADEIAERSADYQRRFGYR